MWCLLADIFVSKCHESSAKVNLGLGGGICPYWQYIENLWHDIQVLKERLFWRPLQHAQPVQPVHQLQINLSWDELTFHKEYGSWLFLSSFWYSRPFEVGLLPSQWNVNVFLWLFFDRPSKSSQLKNIVI